ncbi:MAG: thioredoxin domain-containing protein [bacterium]
MENEEHKIIIEAVKKEVKKDLAKHNQIAGAIVIAGLIIAGSIMLSKGSKPTTGATANISDVKIKAVSLDEHIYGNPNAKVVVIEYSDTECPFSKRFHATMNQVIAKNPNVGWVYRHYPIAQLHPKAAHEAEATECAYEQGGNSIFWKYIDEVYLKTGSNNTLDPAMLSVIAKDIGLDVTAFNTCLDSRKYTAKVETTVNEIGPLETQLSASGILKPGEGLGTPTSFIVKKGKIVEFIHGAEQIETLMPKIEKALK